MPELPEVEVVRAGLNQLITQKTIKSVKVFNQKSFQSSDGDLQSFVLGTSIIEVRRRAKVLMIDLSSEYTLLIHLKMTGQLIFRDENNTEDNFAGGHPNDSMIGSLPDKHTRIEFTLKDETGAKAKLFFNDLRKFGWVKVLPTSQVIHEKFIAKIGPEPLTGKPESEYIRRILRRPRSPVKAAILNQEVVAGIGNIYADEALWGAMVHPATRVVMLDNQKLEEILASAIAVMSLSIEKGGSTDRNYVNAKGEKGSYLEFANVFRREGKPCKRCGTIIEKIRVAGRGTHICPTCQIQIEET